MPDLASMLDQQGAPQQQQQFNPLSLLPPEQRMRMLAQMGGGVGNAAGMAGAASPAAAAAAAAAAQQMGQPIPHAMTVYNGALPTAYTYNPDGSTTQTNPSPGIFQANAGRLSPYEFEQSLHAGMSPQQVNMGDFMRWANTPLGPQQTADPATRMQMLQGFLGMGQQGNANQTAANGTLQTLAQYAPGGLAWQQAATQQQLANHTTSNDRLTDQLIAGMAGNNAAPEHIQAMVQFANGLRPQPAPPRPGPALPGMAGMAIGGPGPGAAAGAAPGAAPAPVPAPGLDLRSMANNVLRANNGIGVPGQPFADVNLPPDEHSRSRAITNFVASLQDSHLAPETLPATWQFMSNRFGADTMNDWFGQRDRSGLAGLVQTRGDQTFASARQRLMDAANRAHPGAVRATHVNAESPWYMQPMRLLTGPMQWAGERTGLFQPGGGN